MKNPCLIITLLLLGQLSILAQVSDTAINKMRSFRIREKRIVSLQAPIDRLKEITIKSNSEHFYLKRGTFGGTDSIDIEVNKANQITAVSFFYDTVSTYQYEVDLFNKHLNLTGKEFQYVSNGSSMKVTKWQDKFTVFEMVEIRTGNKWRIYSVIFDKDLYFKKQKQCLELNKNENSIEILKKLGVL